MHWEMNNAKILIVGEFVSDSSLRTIAQWYKSTDTKGTIKALGAIAGILASLVAFLLAVNSDHPIINLLITAGCCGG